MSFPAMPSDWLQSPSEREGMAIRGWDADKGVFMWAFDLIELDEEDLRRQPLQMRKSTLDVLLSRRVVGLRFNQHIEEDGPIVFEHACKLHLEGIVSKRKESTFRGAQRIG